MFRLIISFGTAFDRKYLYFLSPRHISFCYFTTDHAFKRIRIFRNVIICYYYIIIIIIIREIKRFVTSIFIVVVFEITFGYLNRVKIRKSH